MKKLFPIIYFRNASGGPLAGGKIYTYITDTTTLKATYTTAEGDVLHPNPIILGSDGRKEIWMDTDTQYKLVIYDAADTQIGSAINTTAPTVARPLAVGGADVDITGYSILTTSNDDIRLNPNSTGHVKISDAYFLPSDMPLQNEVLAGNGDTQLVWSTPSAATLNGLSTVTITSVATGNLLKYNAGSSQWVNSAQSTLSVTASQISDLATASVAFTNKTGNISQWTNDSGYITASSSSALTNKSGNISQWTNNSGYSTLSAGSQTNAEAATSSSVSMTPLIMQNHPGVAKAFIDFDATPTTYASYNIASCSFVSGTTYQITFTTAMSSANYTILNQPRAENTSAYMTISSKATTGFRVTFTSIVNTPRVSLACFGDQ